MKRKMLSLLLAFALCLSLAPTMAFAATGYNVWVNGEEFTDEKLEIACGSGTAAYDPAKNQITLNNAAREGARYAVIHYDPSIDWKEESVERMMDSMVGVSSAAAIISDPVEQQITASVTATPRILTGFTSTLLRKDTIELHAQCCMRLEN